MGEKMAWPNEKKSNSPFKEGEIFDAKKRLENLRKKHHGEEGLQHLEEFKKKLNFQELGFSSIEVGLFNLIEENPDASIDDLNKLIENDLKKYALTKKQIGIIFSIFKEYQKKHQSIREIINNYADEKGQIKGRNLYQNFFKRIPKGDVKVFTRSMTINFCPENMDDYAYLISNAYLEGREVDVNDKKIAKKFEGRNLSGSFLEGFNDIVTVEHPFFFNKNINELTNVLEHEEQHVFNRLKTDVYNFDLDKLLNKINNIEKITGAKIPLELRSFLINNYKIEYMVKDEISAYFKGGFSPKYISKMLLGKNTLYDSGFDYNKNKINQDNEFDEKYIKFVKNAVIAFNDLLKYGYGNKEIQNLLFNEPITKWPKIVKRITGKKKTSEDKKKDEGKYISKIINRN